jgi:hypothetical protein
MALLILPKLCLYGITKFYTLRLKVGSKFIAAYIAKTQVLGITAMAEPA